MQFRKPGCCQTQINLEIINNIVTGWEYSHDMSTDGIINDMVSQFVSTVEG